MQDESRPAQRVAPVELSGKKVLVVDDVRANIKILTGVITGSAGMRVVFCESGAEALQAVRKAMDAGDPFDIGILDIMMPGMDGYRLASEIRAQAGSWLPLIAFSSILEVGVARRCQEAGFNGFLPKPIQPSKLFEMMKRLLVAAPAAGVSEIITQHSIREDSKQSVSILLAEDNPVNQKLAVTMLSSAGYLVAVAGTGGEAVRMFTEEPGRYDIVFMDLHMPGMSGLDATREIRNWEGERSQNPESRIRRIPIIAMTAADEMSDREECFAAGMNDFMSKPVRRETIFAMLKKWVFERTAQAAS